MSVKKYNRKQSPTQFLRELQSLNEECGRIMAKMPKKYRANYGDFIIRECLQALSCAVKANSITVSASTSPKLEERRMLKFFEAYEICKALPPICDVFFDMCKNTDGNYERCMKAQITFAEKCQSICSLLSGVMKSDKARFKKYRAEAEKETE